LVGERQGLRFDDEFEHSTGCHPHLLALGHTCMVTDT